MMAVAESLNIGGWEGGGSWDGGMVAGKSLRFELLHMLVMLIIKTKAQKHFNCVTTDY